MYLVLVINKGSNILEDLETLRLCGKVVPEYVAALEEEEVSATNFIHSKFGVLERRFIYGLNEAARWCPSTWRGGGGEYTLP